MTLFVLAGAERRHAQSLRFAAGEQRAAVRAREHAHFGRDRTHGLGVTSIDTEAGVEDGVADDVGLKLLEQPLRLVGVQALGRQRCNGRLLGGGNLVLADLLQLLGVRGGQARAAQLVDADS